MAEVRIVVLRVDGDAVELEIPAAEGPIIRRVHAGDFLSLTLRDGVQVGVDDENYAQGCDPGRLAAYEKAKTLVGEFASANDVLNLATFLRGSDYC